jgi:hypothetical protein
MHDAGVRRCGLVALAGILAFALAAVATQGLRADLDWLDAPLSFYLVGPWGGLLQASYAAMAIALVALGGGYYRVLPPGARSAAPWLLFTAAGVALAVTALAHGNLPGRAPTLEGFVHGTAAQASFLCVTVAMLLQSWRFRGGVGWRARFRGAFTLAAASFVAMWVDALWHGMPRGLEQKLVIALIVSWLLRAAWWLRRGTAQ